jgi:hypothetical protein
MLIGTETNEYELLLGEPTCTPAQGRCDDSRTFDCCKNSRFRISVSRSDIGGCASLVSTLNSMKNVCVLIKVGHDR